MKCLGRTALARSRVHPGLRQKESQALARLPSQTYLYILKWSCVLKPMEGIDDRLGKYDYHWRMYYPRVSLHCVCTPPINLARSYHYWRKREFESRILYIFFLETSTGKDGIAFHCFYLILFHSPGETRGATWTQSERVYESWKRLQHLTFALWRRSQHVICFVQKVTTCCLLNGKGRNMLFA